MSYFDKYMKYKSKFIKHKYNMIGGSVYTFTINDEHIPTQILGPSENPAGQISTESLQRIITLINTNCSANTEEDNKLKDALQISFKLFDDKDNFIVGRYNVNQNGQYVYKYYTLLKIQHDTSPYQDVINQMLNAQTSFCPNITLQSNIRYKLYTYKT